MVEHRLAKARVASSNLVFRSNLSRGNAAAFESERLHFRVSAATVKRLDPTQVELEIAIEAAELDAARERAFKQLVKNVRIPGFRPGKAPRRIFEAQYGTAGIEERAIDAVVPGAYSKAIEDNNLEPVDRPQMELLPEEEGLPLRVRATVSVRPEIELGTYKGLELAGESTAVGDDDVENTVQQLRKDAATLVPVERPIEIGDRPTVDYLGKIDGVPFEGGSAQGQSIEIVESNFIPGFAAGIVGMTAGQTKDVEAKFPDDYQNAELAGKTAVFTITIGGMSFPGYIALYSLVANIVVAVVLSVLLRPFVRPAVAFGGD